jgi:fructose-bisphosphate aldolase, class I
VNLGKKIRLSRIFSHQSGRLCSVAVDHFIGYQKGLPAGLTDLPATLARLVAAGPDAVTMNKGVALTCWAPHAGKAALIIQAGCFTANDSVIEVMTDPDEVVRLGADAIAVAIGVYGPNEGRYLKILGSKVTEAARHDLPVIAHIYPRAFSGGDARILHDPDSIAWAVRAGIECGADIIKVGYTGDVASFSQIVRSSPVPIVAAGGPKAETQMEALTLIGQAIEAGAMGATIGRNIWGAPDPGKALRAFKAVIHEGKSASEAVAGSS